MHYVFVSFHSLEQRFPIKNKFLYNIPLRNIERHK